jgi:hypothetical protein
MPAVEAAQAHCKQVQARTEELTAALASATEGANAVKTDILALREAGKALAKEASERNLPLHEVRERVNALDPPRGKSEPPSGPGFTGTREGDEPQGDEPEAAPASATPPAPKPGKPVPKPSAAPKQQAKPEPDRITCALLPGRQTLPLLARPKGKGALPKAAKKLGDDPWCEITHPNGVVQTFRILVVKGELRLTIDTVRGD